MKLRSRGLGRKELVMDFREYDIAWDNGAVVVTGTIREPVTWDFSIRIEPDDIPGMVRVGLHRATVRLAWNWILRRPAPVVDTPSMSSTERPAREHRRRPITDRGAPRQRVATPAVIEVVDDTITDLSAPADRDRSTAVKSVGTTTPREAVAVAADRDLDAKPENECTPVASYQTSRAAPPTRPGARQRFPLRSAEPVRVGDASKALTETRSEGGNR